MSGWLSATLPARTLATTSVEAVCAAARRAGATGPIATAASDPERIAAAFGSERLFRDGGSGADAFAPLSGFFPAADGWLRTHASYPHHRDRLLRLVGLAADEADRATLARAISARSAAEIENLAVEAGAIAVRVRTEAEWRASEPGIATATGSLVRFTHRDDGAALTLAGGGLPLAGIRVLDLTRVLAGPVCGRTLALLGADVLRLDPPIPAEIEWQQLDTGQGKRTAILDLRTELPRAQELLDAADVLVTGYRPGAIEAFGLRPPPGLIRARVNAWGDTGPWAGRRGFDSIVQAASGIALIESADGTTPGALPAQALDHATGYLLAAAVIDALVARAADGRGLDLAAALARTASWLLDRPGREPGHPPAAAPTDRCAVTHGTRTTARPAIPGFDDYPFPAHHWGTDPAAFD
ncbi:CoA transferase [Pseudofrankia sp. DC12]|uniref:CoA transferase n=1 Tax=Pseudofrankia sp. DC12 TaxID=683315 RepID=UPI0005F81F64|nr:CoA transferase [Pseudofrankia sp. DC12]